MEDKYYLYEGEIYYKTSNIPEITISKYEYRSFSSVFTGRYFKDLQPNKFVVLLARSDV